MSKYKGSKRCMLDLIDSSDFITDINILLEEVGASISTSDTWIPKNSQNDKEAELKTFLTLSHNTQLGAEIQNWWLEICTPQTRTPNWDLVSTCTINGKPGILLVEAKAHTQELNGGSKGKSISEEASGNSKENHKKIGIAINEANTNLENVISGISISRDKCYQFSNRVAHAWWLANQGIPVVLLYLGFLNSEDMRDKYKVFNSHKDWEDCFINHTKKVGAASIINTTINCGKSSFITICRSY
ncbi:hypothetical protein [Flavobacterium sp.]|uniref:hypothetical protein n=1 Tax=Flavobacterium sp. TaxID=239 RepID=UPI002B4B323A|nr:hypothetical protein [Flavobacterium sp.]HLF53239.1 hypothetical protein [Flavobacterium sp.]